MDKLHEQCGNNYELVIIAAKRARQINAYYHALGEGSYEEYAPPMVPTKSQNHITIALEEIANGKIKYTEPEAA